MPQRPGLISIEQLKAAIERDDVDTVVVAIADMQGRLQGKRLSARYFINEVVEHGTEGCNYLLAVDVDMNTVDGYSMSSWERGYGDFVMHPDFDTLRLTPWQPGSALLIADLQWEDGSDVVASPRQVLRRQLARLAELGLTAYTGTELEFIVFRDTYEEAWDKGYSNLVPANQYNVDYSLLGTARIEPLLRRIRRSMEGAGLYVESAKGECNFGQHEIAFRYADALTTADNHSVYKEAAKEIAAQEGMALTFMAKFNEREGNSCHIHISVRGNGDKYGQDETVMVDPDNSHEMSPLGRSFVAGQLKHMRELTLLSAPNINSYKRFVPGSFAPTTVAWGRDNRTCAVRLVGHGQGLRMENRVPGGDINPYLATSALVAAGIDGIENELELEDALVGNAYNADLPKVPHTMDDALRLWEGSEFARSAYGDDVVDHYANMAKIELASYSSTVTDWERRRNFERF
jgi:glutamine synthetase